MARSFLSRALHRGDTAEVAALSATSVVALDPVEIPSLSVYDLLFADLADADLDRVALIDGASGDETSYRQLVAQIDALAGSLASRGLAVGDRVGILCPNIPAFATVFHGVLRAGGTATTINSLYTPGEIANQLTSAEAGWLFTVSPLYPQAKEAADAAGIPAERLVVIDGVEGHPSLRDLLFDRAIPPTVRFDPATHLAVLPYSSGTTGHPKGVMLTHRNLVANVLQCERAIGLGRDDRVLAVLPFFHIYGMSVLLDFALLKRAALVTMPRFDLTEFLRTVSEHRCTWVFIAPPIAVALAKHPLVDDYDLSSVKVVFSGAAPLDRTLASAVAERLGCEVCQGYGMTETSPVTHVIPVGEPGVDRSSIGRAVPGTECRLIDVETGAELALPGEGTSAPGELLVRGPQVMPGYLHDDEATSRTLDPEGWLHTGDIATVDADGVFTIVDRLKELIKYKGYQVAPAVLEAVLLAHPEIADAAVVGVPDDDGQEVPKAYVVRTADADLDEETVIAWVQDRVAPHEKVRLVEFIDVIPKSASGKILRKDLRGRVGRHAAA
ncbi:AMP-binding protein [Herbiconiux sp. CPCC 203407]|uniref:AMP-binding protein n=1 Tax=Herbiconiux oxytropis TaxID=2970915 RepID=A0AA41XJD7_9MICO|nr:AMP-binding protein [Herbiconiux oxytropis]MCS5723512.1 AMP-binding protein [Herbiconiux oxytropis]MCS5726431.1 AMP-binding protein [Herbiconiux oxytropis]